ncbi:MULTISPECIES: MBL fold metallo-hydrolase [Niastella]|uniref:Metallo-beta-lactamase domain-containing protein n=1 Tax=Niastella soli TaxID=2821487 RepID=A0ABS3YWV3_9BACT|nr:hypothetical protein [Niastella soli]MBO9202412.1 hypothetical protein [Niastella soli]
MQKISHAEVRMYRLGTGDCFAIKFFSKEKEEPVCKLMIDAGTWSGSGTDLEPYIKDLKQYLDNYADVLIVTHEHKDHVHAFDVCKELFTEKDTKGKQFEVGELWMGWTENDRLKKVKEWKEDYGEKKKALGIAALTLQETMASPEFKKQFEGNRDAAKMLGARETFGKVLNGFADLHVAFEASSTGKVYKGGLAGMEVVKKDIKKKEVKYYKPGDVIQGIGNVEGIRIYVLGPPELQEEIAQEAGGEGESYQHNKVLRESDTFGAAILHLAGNDNGMDAGVLPFDEKYYDIDKRLEYIQEPEGKEAILKEVDSMDTIKKIYEAKDWRRIDYDWLFSAGAFALRMNGLTNNLSLAVAIEFVDSGRVMLFPGDAEFGSWASWHTIDWKEDDRSNGNTDGKKQKHLTEDLLNRTVFYKVAHHLSHNGTAQRLGLEMMKHKDLAAMATLDYNKINDGWTSTMPNRSLIKELLLRTRGRLMIMNEEGLFYDFNEEVPMKDKIEDARNSMTDKERKAFEKDFISNKRYLQYTVKA